MKCITRMITSGAACAALAAPALAHSGHGGGPLGHTHGILDSLGVQGFILALIVVGLFIAVRLGGHAMRRYVRQS